MRAGTAGPAGSMLQTNRGTGVSPMSGVQPNPERTAFVRIFAESEPPVRASQRAPEPKARPEDGAGTGQPKDARTWKGSTTARRWGPLGLGVVLLVASFASERVGGDALGAVQGTVVVSPTSFVLGVLTAAAWAIGTR